MEKHHHQRLQLRVLSHPIHGTFVYVAPGQYFLPGNISFCVLVSSFAA